MSGLCELVAFLLLLKYGTTGAVVWLRHGYDGAAFVWSQQFDQALQDWKIFRGERKDIAQHKAQVEAAAAWRPKAQTGVDGYADHCS